MLPPAIWGPPPPCKQALRQTLPVFTRRKAWRRQSFKKKIRKSVSFQRVIACSQTLYFLFFTEFVERAHKSKKTGGGGFVDRKRKEWGCGKEKNVFLARSLRSRAVRTG